MNLTGGCMIARNLGLCCLSASLLLVACDKKTEEKKAEISGVPVTVAQSESRKMALLEESVGVLESLADPVVSAEVAGRVAEVRAVAGAEVKAGQVLAVLDGRDAGLSRQAAQAEAGRVGSLSANQTRNLERLKQLREKNFISQAALDDAIAQNAATENQLSGARAQLGLAERTLGKTNVLAPVDGRVERQIAITGQYVKVGDPMFQVVSLKKLRARLPFPETLSGLVQRGMPVQISVAGSDAKLNGKISEIRPMATANNRAFDAFALFDNPGNWRPGATVTATVVLEEHADAVTVPEQSVVLRPAGEVVYVVEAGVARQRVVQVGINQDGRVEITGGLQANETVVVDGAGFLTDGAKVAVNAAQPPGGVQ
ncbi:MAG TPA: efflux RND transporter periplasmic adaptor subunit [Gallionellaceae bacterium]|nr:efflux RND transporter periplasmic adaptor subunit [Gallionellaceae bacterium]